MCVVMSSEWTWAPESSVFFSLVFTHSDDRNLTHKITVIEKHMKKNEIQLFPVSVSMTVFPFSVADLNVDASIYIHCSSSVLRPIFSMRTLSMLVVFLLLTAGFCSYARVLSSMSSATFVCNNLLLL